MQTFSAKSTSSSFPSGISSVGGTQKLDFVVFQPNVLQVGHFDEQLLIECLKPVVIKEKIKQTN